MSTKSKEEYITFIEETFKSRGLAERYEYFKKVVIFDKGLTLEDFVLLLKRYEIINKAKEWSEFRFFEDLITLELEKGQR